MVFIASQISTGDQVKFFRRLEAFLAENLIKDWGNIVMFFQALPRSNDSKIVASMRRLEDIFVLRGAFECNLLPELRIDLIVHALLGNRIDYVFSVLENTTEDLDIFRYLMSPVRRAVIERILQNPRLLHIIANRTSGSKLPAQLLPTKFGYSSLKTFLQWTNAENLSSAALYLAELGSLDEIQVFCMRAKQEDIVP